MKFIYDDGGRKEAGFKGKAGDCVCRAISIASGSPYIEVWQRLADSSYGQRSSSRTKKKERTADKGINTRRKWFKEYMRNVGFVWVPTMHLGSGCVVHLRDGELPMGRLVVAISKHYVAVIDGVIYDTHDCSRDGNRCVYGYYQLINQRK
jgi:hypothetical protein